MKCTLVPCRACSCQGVFPTGTRSLNTIGVAAGYEAAKVCISGGHAVWKRHSGLEVHKVWCDCNLLAGRACVLRVSRSECQVP